VNLKDITMAIPDVQSSADSRQLPINKVGIKSIRHPVKVLDKSEIGRASCRERVS
jgi:GTP cyclohydrolase I